MTIDIAGLQKSLVALGFDFVKRAQPGQLDVFTRQGIREFRRYSRMQFVAKEDVTSTAPNYIDRLSSVANPNITPGPIHDGADQALLDVINSWVGANLRCPVVIQAWSIDKKTGNPKRLNKQNVWLNDDVKKTWLRMFGFDFSRYYDAGDLKWMPVGEYQSRVNKKKVKSEGPLSEAPKHTNTEVTPENLVGLPLNQLTPQQRSTFKVVRAVSEVECEGYFDAINAFDHALLSSGLCQWTLGVDLKLQPAELPAFLAHLQKKQPVAFEQAVGSFGVAPAKAWGNDGSALKDTSLLIYHTNLRHQAGDSSFQDIPDEEANFYRSWHWFYRFEMAGRTIPGYRTGMWGMARLRIRDIRSAKWDDSAGVPADTPTVGDVFTSERATALLFRWHVIRPSDLFDETTNTHLNNVYQRATKKASPKAPPKTIEERLIEAILFETQKKVRVKELTKTITQVNGFPNWLDHNPRKFELDRNIGALDTSAKSFLFDDSGLDAPASAKLHAKFAVRAEAVAAPSALIPVLFGYSGKNPQPTYEVRSDGTTFHESGAPDVATIDRLVLFDANAATAPPLWVIKLIQLDELGISGNVVIVAGAIRNWVKTRFDIQDIDAQFTSFNFQLNFAAGKVQFQSLVFDVDEKQNFLLGDLSAQDKVWVEDDFSGKALPFVASAIGLNGLANVPCIASRVRFAPPPESPTDSADPCDQAVSSSGAGFSPSLRMSIDSQLPVSTNVFGSDRFADPSSLSPYPKVVLDAHDYPRDDSGNGFIGLAQRQPTSLAAQPPFEDGEHLVLEVQIPLKAAGVLWNQTVVAPVTRALPVVQDGRPLSVIPKLPEGGEVNSAWAAHYSLVDLNATQFRSTVAMPSEPPEDGAATLFPRILSPQAAHPAQLIFPALQTTTGTLLSAVVQLLPGAEPEQLPARSQQIPGFLFRINQLNPTGGAGAQTVRMGALDLHFLPAPQTNAGTVIPSLPAESNCQATFLTARGQLQEIGSREAGFSLAVTAVRPGGQDDIPGEEFTNDLGFTTASDETYRAAFDRAPSIILPLQSPGESQSAFFFLTVREVTAPGKSQTVMLRLRRNTEEAAAPGDEEVLVFDPHPFLLTKVKAADFQKQISEAVTDEIGNWTNRSESGAGWQLGAGASGFDLMLPPQGMGEAMHRRSGLHDIDLGQPAAFRLTPNTHFRLRPSLTEQNFVEVPWNLRRTLGFPGQRAPGAPVDRLDFEMLYGMPGSVSFPTLQVTEIGARLGTIPGQQPPALPWRHDANQSAVYNKFRCQWRDMFGALRSRLAILEPWEPTQGATLELTAARGLSYQLRKEADLRYPIPGSAASNPAIPHGALAGSFSWAFESKNVYEAVWRNPQSVDALLARPYFSALGGWGYHKATFDSGRTAIYADIAMGRLSSLTVERLGRIAIYWNRAKHVIVYERTVAASRQFYLEQEPFTGNPLLRKVDEYIELIEDERAYPDSAAPAVSRGPLLACRFPGQKPPRIRVNSRWGEDVNIQPADGSQPFEGWKIPLWMANAGPADVYPRPPINLVFAGHEDGKTVPAGIGEPDKLFFFTSTRSNEAGDSNTWQAVPGLDYPILEMLPGNKSVLDPPPPPAASSNLADVAAVKDANIIGGLGAFTHLLDPVTSPVNVMADRASNAISSAIANVTPLRALTVATQAAPDFFNLSKVVDGLGNGFASYFSRLLPVSDAPFPNLGGLKDFLKDASDALDGARTLASTLANLIKPDIDLQQLKDRIQSQQVFLAPVLRRETEAILLRYASAFLDAAADIRAELGETFNDDVRNALRAALEDLLEGTGEAPGFRGVVDALPGTIGETVAGLDSAVDRIQDTIADADEAIQVARAQIGALDWSEAEPPRADAEPILGDLRAAVAEALQAVDFLVPEAPRSWLGNCLDNLRPAVRQALVDIDEAARAVRYLLRSGSITLDQVEAKLDDLTARLQALQSAIIAKLTAWGGQIEDLTDTGLAAILESLENDLQAVIAAAAAWDAFEAQIPAAVRSFVALKLDAQFSNAVQALEAILESHAAALRDVFFASIADFLSDIGKLADPAAIDRLTAAMQSAVPTFSNVRDELDRVYQAALAILRQLVTRLKLAIPMPSFSLPNVSDVFNLARVFGAPPEVPGLHFPSGLIPDLSFPKDLGYYFNLRDFGDLGVRITPVVAEANKLLGDLLNPIEIKLPSIALGERLMPFSLPNFDLSSIFPKFAGLNLQNLFSGLKMPEAGNDHVVVTHGLDPQTRTGWVQIDVNMPLADDATVFSVAGVVLRLKSSNFQATSRITASVASPAPRQTTRGAIIGDFDLQIGGFPVALLAQCTLEFEDGGNIRFNVSPDRIRLQQVLAFLSDLMSKFGYSDKGFSIAVAPTGVRTTLDLPLPDIQSGAFGIANLRLGFAFGLTVVPFAIEAQLSVGRKTAPFTLTIFILGGAGWLEFAVLYTPSDRTFETNVSIGILASASLAIALGPIKGGVYAYFGITVEYHCKTGQAGNLTIGLLLLFVGEVSLLGIVSVSLRMGLEAQYTSGGGLVGRGFVSFSIKICWFLTINVSASVEYRFGSPARTQTLAVETLALNPALEPELTYREAAQAYVDMFA